MPTILITGGHSGIGLECVRQLAADPTLRIVLAGRSPDRMSVVADQLRQDYDARVSTLEMDTASLTSVRKAVSSLRSMLDSGEVDLLQAILCNAGGRAFGRNTYSPDGYEQTFAGNFLGHFLLVNLLVTSLADDGRVVFTSSGTHDRDTRDGKAVGPAIQPDAIKLANSGKEGEKTLSAGVLYATSKLCIILFSYELHRRLRKSGSGISSIAFDPGAVLGTSFLRNAPASLRFIAESTFGQWMMKRTGFTTGTIEISGASLAKLAIDPAYANGSGKYFQVNNGAFVEARSARFHTTRCSQPSYGLTRRS